MLRPEQLRKVIDSYPDAALCFCLGYLPPAVFIGFVGELFCLFFGLSKAENAHWWCEALLGAVPAGTVSLVFGYLIRRFQQNSRYRWVWLSFVIPLVGMAVTWFIAVSQSGTQPQNSIEDGLCGVAVYLLVALIFGMASVALIGLFKIVEKLWSPTSEAL